MDKLQLVKSKFNYSIVNKSSNIICGAGLPSISLIPLLSQVYHETVPQITFDPEHFRICQRLDRFVTGGLIVARNKKWANMVRKALSDKEQSKLKITRKYVGLLPIPQDKPISSIFSPYSVGSDSSKGLIFDDDTLTSGIIKYDIIALEKDYYTIGNTVPRKLQSYPAKTKFKLLTNLIQPSTQENINQYPLLFQDIKLVPIIFELFTGRKNQIRDHVIQAFNTPLLNDDNFLEFKLQSVTAKVQNSIKFHHNQIGLHSAYFTMKSSQEFQEFIFPIFNKQDQIIWQGFLQGDQLIQEIIQEIIH